jgi:hypothetical protein
MMLQGTEAGINIFMPLSPAFKQKRPVLEPALLGYI